MTVKHRQLAPTVGQISDDPPTNAIAIFKFLVAMPKGTTFIFESWVSVADAHGGFRSHLNNSARSEIIQSSIINNTTELSDQIEELSLDDREKIQFENFFNLEKTSKTTHSTNATNHGKALAHDENLDDEPISVIGRHLDLTFASTPQGHFMY